MGVGICWDLVRAGLGVFEDYTIIFLVSVKATETPAPGVPGLLKSRLYLCGHLVLW